MVANHRKPVVPTRVPRAGTGDRRSQPLPVLIRIPKFASPGATAGASARLAAMIESAIAFKNSPRHMLERSGTTVFQFLLHHPRLVAGTTLTVVLLLAAMMFVHESSPEPRAEKVQVASTSPARPSVPAPAASEAPPWGRQNESASSSPAFANRTSVPPVAERPILNQAVPPGAASSAAQGTFESFAWPAAPTDRVAQLPYQPGRAQPNTQVVLPPPAPNTYLGQPGFSPRGTNP